MAANVGGLLEGRVVAVTGGGRGVGRAHALACARAGARVLVNDLGCDPEGVGSDPRVAEEVARAIREAGGEASADATDVGTAAGPQRVVERALEVFGRLDAVIGAAGVVGDRGVLKMDDATLDRMIDVHVRGAFGLVRAAGRAFLDREVPGSIVLCTGTVGFFGAARQSALAATSAAVAGLVRSAAIELRRHQIRVNAIAPTARTRTTEALPLFRGIAPDSMGPELIAPVGVFLSSDLASEVSGEVLGVAGARVYAIQGRETPGWFGDGGVPSPQDIADAWSDITRA